MTPDIGQARAYIAALKGSEGAVCAFRAIHETDGGRPPKNITGTIDQVWQSLCQLNDQNYGIFLTVNNTDGLGFGNANVNGIIAQFVDLDEPATAQQSLNAATAWNPCPSFMVNSSPGKFHVYWLVNPHNDHQLFTFNQRRLITMFNSDKSINDPARVMRVPGFFHRKRIDAPSMVTCAGLGGARTDSSFIDVQLFGTIPSDQGGAVGGTRTPFGEGERAPNTQAAIDMLYKIQVAELTDRNQWVAVSGAFMQAIDPVDVDEAKRQWMHWNSFYTNAEGVQNDPGANEKLWRDIQQHGTSVGGWSRLHKEATGVTPREAATMGAPITGTALLDRQTAAQAQGVAPVAMAAQPSAPVAVDTETGFGNLLDENDQVRYFDGCVLINTENLILCKDNARRSVSDFNIKYTGHTFKIDINKVTDEAWKAMTRNQLVKFPQAEYMSFRPTEPLRSITTDGLGRRYVNLYKPAVIEHYPGDISRFLRHMEILFPDPTDRHVLFSYMAHNIKFPGHKIFWAPLIQGAEGMGKNLIKNVMVHGMSPIYAYQPKASELIDSGAKFNGWMEHKTIFIVDEVRTDEKRELMEALKPMITELQLEIQAKGKDQKMGDIPGNFIFFSNFKDAMPVTWSTRRHCIMFSAMQDIGDLLAAGCSSAYFNSLYNWLNKEGGLQMVVDWLLNYEVEAGSLPTVAPHTTSTAEAVTAGRGWLAGMIAEAVEAGENGFKGGFISTAAIGRVLHSNEVRTMPKPATIGAALRELGYHRLGQAAQGYFNDDPANATKRAYIYCTDKVGDLNNYGSAQGYL